MLVYGCVYASKSILERLRHTPTTMSLVLFQPCLCSDRWNPKFCVLTQTHYVEMKSDGVKIATDVMLPTIKVPKDHKFPAVFFQTRSAYHAPH